MHIYVFYPLKNSSCPFKTNSKPIRSPTTIWHQQPIPSLKPIPKGPPTTTIQYHQQTHSNTHQIHTYAQQFKTVPDRPLYCVFLAGLQWCRPNRKWTRCDPNHVLSLPLVQAYSNHVLSFPLVQAYSNLVGVSIL